MQGPTFSICSANVNRAERGPENLIEEFERKFLDRVMLVDDCARMTSGSQDELFLIFTQESREGTFTGLSEELSRPEAKDKSCSETMACILARNAQRMCEDHQQYNLFTTSMHTGVERFPEGMDAKHNVYFPSASCTKRVAQINRTKVTIPGKAEEDLHNDGDDAAHPQLCWNVTFANVHLSGGKEDDTLFRMTDMLDSRAKFMHDLVEKYEPDIILGDFNGSPNDGDPDIFERIEKDVNTIESQDDFLKESQNPHPLSNYLATIFCDDDGRHIDLKQIKSFLEWRQAPFRILEHAGYTRATHGDDAALQPTSMYGHAVDFIYYKRDRLKQLGQGRIVKLFDDSQSYRSLKELYKGSPDNLSDHHAVCARFQVLLQRS